MTSFESLSSFEMVQRGFKEAREALLLERRQTELARQLSTFLADASLALDASDSLEEMLRLVAEQPPVSSSALNAAS